jgi:hypothetical protein
VTDLPTPRLSAARLSLTATALLCTALSGAPRRLDAQELRSLDVARQLHDSSPLLVRVRYAAGKLALRATDAPVLYRMQLAYLPDAVRPLHSFAPATRTLRVGVEKRGVHVPGGGDRTGDMHLDLARAVPLDLDMELGAVAADLDLSGLRVGDLHVESGASDAQIRFATPNAERMRSLDLEVGAASLHASGLANANASEIRVQAGVGDVELNFDGAWTQSVELNVRVALGGVTIRVPREVGVRVEAQKFLASFDAQGLVKRGNAYYSDNWDTATHRLSVRAQTTFGSLRVERTARQ